jgi:twitching motility protein PilI
VSALAETNSAALPAAERHADDDSSWLGIALGDANWLLDPADVAEAIPVPHITPVPFTRAWFAGVACIRGVPLAVVDLHAFFTATTLQAAEHARLVVVADGHRINSALLVARVLGLEPRARFVREPEAIPASAPWIEGHYRDEEGRRWAALDMASLLSHPSFLRIEEPASP